MNETKDNVGIQDEPKGKTEEEQIAAAKMHFMVDSTMAHKAGRDLVWELLARYGVYRSDFDENPITMAKNVGMSEAGLILLDLILSECPDKHDLMFAEHRLKLENENG